MSDDRESAAAQIAELRAQIDAIDCELVGLLNRRAQIALDIRHLKPAAHVGLYDPKREEEIFAKLGACNAGPLFAENLREIWEAILHVMKEQRG